MTKKRKRRLTKILAALILVSLVSFAVLCLHKEPIERKILPLPYNETVTTLAEEYDFPPSLIYAVTYTESKFDPNAHSSADALGLMQITEDTYHWACKRTKQEVQDIEKLYDPETNLQYGVIILSLLREQFENIETVLAAYNAGQGKVNEWLKDPACSKDGKTLSYIPYEETENYVRRVINIQKKYQKLYNIM